MKVHCFLLMLILVPAIAKEENESEASVCKHWEDVTGIRHLCEIARFQQSETNERTQLVQVRGPAEKTLHANPMSVKGINKVQRKQKKEKSFRSSRAQRCRPTKKCKKANGKCIHKGSQCKGKLIKNGCKTSVKSCKKTHVCCVPPVPCKKPKGKCKKKGGKCIGKDEFCSGQITSKGCMKKDGCKCCYHECPDSWVRCDNGNCVPDFYVCDGFDDCGDNSDEGEAHQCPPPCTSDEFKCELGECIPKTKRCDGTSDCTNNQDEVDCPWSYGGAGGTVGPDEWSKVYPICGNSSQSPINLGPDSHEVNLGDITFYNYTNKMNAYGFINENELFGIGFTFTDNLTIQGGGITPPQRLVVSTIHWGSDSSKGSEHTVNNTRYPMEMHLYHGDVVSGIQSTIGLLSILFEISNADNQALEPIIHAASEMAEQEGPFKYASVENLQLSSLLPSNTEEFYRYNGSITFPTCEEIAQWTVFTQPSTVSEKQLNVLRSINIGNKSISNNFRPTQPINGRTVLLNKSE